MVERAGQLVREAVGWEALTLVSRRRLEKKYGPVALRFKERALVDPVAAPTFVLEKKAFRRALRAVLPEDHEPLAIASESNAELRRQKAARAYQRMQEAEAHVPALGVIDRGARYLVWSSPKPNPAEAAIPELASFSIVEAGELPKAVCSLWASVFFEGTLSRLSHAVRKIELAVGATRLSERGSAPLLELLLEAAITPAPLLPAFGQGEFDAPLTEFDRSLFARTCAVAMEGLGALVRRRPDELISISAGRIGLDPAAVHVRERAAATPEARAVVRDLLGEPAALVDAPFDTNPSRWLSLVGTLLEDHRSDADMRSRIESEERDLVARFGWFREMDLAIVPDDGLRATIEDLLGAAERASSLAARAASHAALHGRAHGMLTGVPITELDRGLDLPALRFFQDLEEAMTRVRTDEALVAMLRARSEGPGGSVQVDGSRVGDDALEPLPDGPGVRALVGLVELHPEMLSIGAPPDPFAPGFRVEVPPGLRQLLPLLLEPGRAVETRRIQAELDADRSVAALEARVPRWAAAHLAPLRRRARQGVELRERARAVEVRIDHLLRRVVRDVGRRLPRLDLGLDQDAVWHCRLSEILRAVDMTGQSLGARVSWRRAELARIAAVGSPYVGSTLPSVSSLGFAEEQGLAAPASTSLARVRGLGRLPMLLVLPHRVEYRGRASDTLPTVARALGIELVSGSLAPRGDSGSVRSTRPAPGPLSS